MSGIAPVTVYITAALVTLLAIAWGVARIFKATVTAKVLAISFWATAAICFAFLVIDKMISVSYTEGLYLSIGIMFTVGLGAGLALRKVQD